MDQMGSAPLITEELLPVKQQRIRCIGFHLCIENVRESTEAKNCNHYEKKKKKKIKSLRVNSKKCIQFMFCLLGLNSQAL